MEIQLQTTMTAPQQSRVRMETDAFNNELKAKGLAADNDMGQDKYLKLLVTQLRHQDPTNPLQNHEFAAQMAQFSSLEQMTQMNTTMKTLLQSTKSDEMFQMLGKQIEYISPVSESVRSGIANAIGFAGGEHKLYVDGNEVSPADIISVSVPQGGSE